MVFKKLIKQPLVILAFFAVSTFPLFNYFIMYPAFRDIIVSQLEEKGNELTVHLVGMMSETAFNPPNLPELSQETVADIQQFFSDFDIIKVRVFQKDGVIIYSSVPEEVSKKNSKPYFTDIISKGENYTKLTIKDGDRNAEGHVISEHIVEAYVPIMKENEFYGAVEVYYDITKEVHAVQRLIRNSTFFIVSFGALLFVVVLQATLSRIKSQERLEKSEELYRHLVEDIGDDYFIYTHDDQGKINYVSPSIKNILDVDPKSAIGKPWQEVLPSATASAESQQLDMKVQDLLQPGRKLPGFEVKFVRKDGEVRYLDNQVRPHLDKHGALASIHGIVKDITIRKKLELKLLHMATVDPLTGVNNRRQLFELARRELNRARRYGHKISLLMMDIDHFKKINDTYGHNVGDEVLIAMSKECVGRLRNTDVFARVGGEEFAALLVETGDEHAQHVAEQLRAGIEEMTVSTDAGPLKITMSVGVASVSAVEDITLEKIFILADSALYEAKRNGRNQVAKSHG